MFGQLYADLRLALRNLIKQPALGLIVVVTLALGVGANTAVYSAFKQMVARSLPVPEAAALVNFGSPGPKAGMTSTTVAGSHDAIFSYPMYRDLVESDQRSLSGIAAHRHLPVNIAIRGQTVAASGSLVSANYFNTLQLQPALGRLFGTQDDRPIGEPKVAVLSHAFWRNNLGAATDVVGSQIVVNGVSLQVIGVAPAGFVGTSVGAQPQVYLPLSMAWALGNQAGTADDRRSYWLYLFGRLQPGVSAAQAQAELNRIYAPLLADVEAPLQVGMSDTLLTQFKAKQLILTPGAGGQSRVSEIASDPLTLLIAVSLLVLLVACLNTANLLLARATARSGEMAIRASLGASRGRIVRLQLVEASLLALLGGAASIPVALAATRALLGLMPPSVAPLLEQAPLDPQVLLYALIVSMATVLCFGLIPALHAARVTPQLALKGAGSQSTASPAAARFRHTLATAQIGLSMVALVVAGLFVQSLNNLDKVDLGLRTDQLSAFAVSPGRNGYDQQRNLRIYDEIESALRALPGVSEVSTSRVSLLSDSDHGTTLSVEGQPRDPGNAISSYYNVVGRDHFATLGIPLLAGRDFSPGDNADSSPVALVNRRFAEDVGWGTAVIGKRLARGEQSELDIEVIGLVADAHYDQVRGPAPAQVYFPRQQSGNLPSSQFYLRSSLPTEQLMPSIRAAVAEVDPNLPVENLRSMPEQINHLLVVDRVVGVLCAAFAVLATLLAAGGIYGSLSYTLSQRRREIGLRLALGANRARVRSDALRTAMRMLAVGGAVGLLAALAVGRAASGLLFGLDGHNPWVIGSAVVLLSAVAMVSALGPASRAARQDPVEALRES